MGLFLRILVIVFEVIYYSLFMKQARKEGKLTRYLLLFVLFSLVSFFMNDSSLVSYAIILIMILYGLKYVVKLNISLYDLFFILVMMLFKLFDRAIVCISNKLFHQQYINFKSCFRIVKDIVCYYYRF